MPIAALPVTLVTAAACAFLTLWLSIRIGRTRGAEKISVGDGGSEPLICRMRAQANFVENAPFVLALVGLIEFTAGTSIWLWVAAVAFLVARIAHGVGMDGGAAKGGRAIGTGVTMLLMLLLGLWALALPLVAERSSHPMIVDMAEPKA